MKSNYMPNQRNNTTEDIASAWAECNFPIAASFLKMRADTHTHTHTKWMLCMYITSNSTQLSSSFFLSFDFVFQIATTTAKQTLNHI